MNERRNRRAESKKDRSKRGRGAVKGEGAEKKEGDLKVLALSIDYAMRQPRIAFYSPLSSALLNYLKSVTPRFSISEEVARLVEAELIRRYPVLGVKIRRMLEKKLKRRGVSRVG
ncbi:MAG: hypothetical protein NZ920_03805 [Aigarchaeota archaeon]|nr:hypothetical protein [Aigarchaeota archaeon]MDW8092254.1 hypothetical protein [Nitrososphaerota archaeon]